MNDYWAPIVLPFSFQRNKGTLGFLDPIPMCVCGGGWVAFVTHRPALLRHHREGQSFHAVWMGRSLRRSRHSPTGALCTLSFWAFVETSFPGHEPSNNWSVAINSTSRPSLHLKAGGRTEPGSSNPLTTWLCSDASVRSDPLWPNGL